MAKGTPRIVMEGVSPEVDGGRFPVKRIVGDEVVVEADIFSDGHDLLAGVLLFRHESQARWKEVPLEFLVNDRWRARFRVDRMGTYRYTFRAWVDRYGTWRQDLEKRVQAGQEISVDLQIGADLLRQAVRRLPTRGAKLLTSAARRLRAKGASLEEKLGVVRDEAVARWARGSVDPEGITQLDRELRVTVDREKARFSAWYEIFPRSWGAVPGRHATFRELEAHLPTIASMGFDVLYLTPIHPIARTNRKGKNNALAAGPDDPGSPWAIGAREGGHKAIHPELGSLIDFRRLIAKANEVGLEIALDIAFQCSPDHPYVREHPGWFRWGPDGTIRYAENPPKKYEDIYPLNFEIVDPKALWEELQGIFLFWIRQGVRIFRVDNPHTKPFAFWEWVIAEMKRKYPEVILLSEAFTRPKIMVRLAKLGFTQSYTYFTWRNTRQELTDYFTELTDGPLREFFRPSLWPNTPDILTGTLQTGGRPAFRARLLLAATLGASYGIYGPAFELGENAPREPGSEEYLNSEKYEIKRWNLNDPQGLRDLIARVNRIRRENPALQRQEGLRFHPTDNDQLLCYSKCDPAGGNRILVVVNLDPRNPQSGWTNLRLDALGLEPEEPFDLEDLLGSRRYAWRGSRNFVRLDPAVTPAHLFRLKR